MRYTTKVILLMLGNLGRIWASDVVTSDSLTAQLCSRAISTKVVCDFVPRSHYMKHVAQSCVRSCLNSYAILLKVVCNSVFKVHYITESHMRFYATCYPKSDQILCNTLHRVVPCPRIAQNPTSAKQWSTHPSDAMCHLQLYNAPCEWNDLQLWDTGNPYYACTEHATQNQCNHALTKSDWVGFLYLET